MNECMHGLIVHEGACVCAGGGGFCAVMFVTIAKEALEPLSDGGEVTGSVSLCPAGFPWKT